MKRIVFISMNECDGREITDFLNHYCIGFDKYSGTSKYYAVDYDGYDYKIHGYHAFLCKDQADNKKFESVHTFKGVVPSMKFPKELQMVMIEKGEAHSFIPYLLTPSADSSTGGFVWDKTKEGQDFWMSVIENHDYELFYKHFTFKKYESRLCNEDSPFGGDSNRNPSSICSRFNKARIAVQPLSYRKVFGRG